MCKFKYNLIFQKARELVIELMNEKDQQVTAIFFIETYFLHNG